MKMLSRLRCALQDKIGMIINAKQEYSIFLYGNGKMFYPSQNPKFSILQIYQFCSFYFCSR